MYWGQSSASTDFAFVFLFVKRFASNVRRKAKHVRPVTIHPVKTTNICIIYTHIHIYRYIGLATTVSKWTQQKGTGTQQPPCAKPKNGLNVVKAASRMFWTALGFHKV